MQTNRLKRLLSMLLVLAFLAGFAVPVNATRNRNEGTGITWTQVDNSEVSAMPMELAEKEEPLYADTEIVRVSIFLEENSTMDQGFGLKDIAQDAEAMAYRQTLKDEQTAVTAAIEKKLGQTLDVAWNLTLVANVISANVAYGQIKAIESVPGVEKVMLEVQYEPAVVEQEETVEFEPFMATSGAQIGSYGAWASGYTGAGMRVAIVDTGTDTNHQSLDVGAYQYSLAYQAGLKDMTVEEYVESLDLLDAHEIASVSHLLNVKVNANAAYLNAKMPFGYNYKDSDYDITNDNDSTSSHGSHVAGISVANAYIPEGDGTYADALARVGVKGVAPDAQLITMKVFGKAGNPYESDFMAAIEDAAILGCDSVNLSLGTEAPGHATSSVAAYQEVMEKLVDTDMVVAIAAGNTSYWAAAAVPNYHLFADDVNLNGVGNPASYTNSLAVASVNNDGAVHNVFYLGETPIGYNEPGNLTVSGYKSLGSIAGEYEYIIIDGVGASSDWSYLGDLVKGKILICQQGTYNFSYKANQMAAAGGVAGMVYASSSSAPLMDLSSYTYTNPCVSINYAASALLKSLAEPIKINGVTRGYAGTMKISVTGEVMVDQYNSDYYTMSDFSSWGVPGDLSMKPEITAPGGNIYSLNGLETSGRGYEVLSGTSMATPQVTGMAALVIQYIEENGLVEKTGLTSRQLAHSLLMSTAVPMRNGTTDNGDYWPILQQGAGLANVDKAISAQSYIIMGEDATETWADGKVKAELGHDPERTGKYSFTFNLHNLLDEEQAYVLSADFFTQGWFEETLYDVTKAFMDLETDPLLTEVTWKVNGVTLKPDATDVTMDFDGNGVVNTADGQLLLDYATGLNVSLNNQSEADLDADGDVDTHDAYLFFSRISTGTALVPANGAVNVEVTITIPEEVQERLEEQFPCGTYVQGYVYAQGATNAEGVMGTCHSIPVLGFYGNWTDSSMYDFGSYHDLESNELGMSYTRAGMGSYLTIAYGDDPYNSYVFRGNPVVMDSRYMPERNAINSENGDVISGAEFDPIRNVYASRYLATNKTTGKTMIEQNFGSLIGIYLQWINANMGIWTGGYIINFDRQPMDAREGDQLEFRLDLAPEYYVDNEGNVDWDAMGKGASLVIPVTVDNTKPQMYSVALDLMNNAIVVKASDDRYLAGVGLYTRSGKTLLAAAGSKTDIQPGETAEYVIPLDDVNGNEFLIQVCDYAFNRVTYALDMQIGAEPVLPDARAFNRFANAWCTLLERWNYTEYYDWEDPKMYRAATIAEKTAFVVTDDGNLYAAPEEDFRALELVRNLGMQIDDMAYNKVDGKIYGTGEGKLVTIDKYTGMVAYVCQMPFGEISNALAIDGEGTFYTNFGPDYADIYSFTLDTVDDPQFVARIPDNRFGVDSRLGPDSYYGGLQPMEWNFNENCIDWIDWGAVPSKYEDPNEFFYESTMWSYYVEDDDWEESDWFFDERHGAFMITDRTEPDTWVWPEDEVTLVDITESTATIYLGGNKTLNGAVLPWNVSDRNLTWTTSDENVAIVDATGKVTGVGVGTATITATSRMNPNFKDTCTVTVEKLNATISGVVMDPDAVAHTYTWDLSQGGTWTEGVTLEAPLANAAMGADGYLYGQEDGGSAAMMKIDPATGKVVEKSGACLFGANVLDLAVMETAGTATEPQFMGVVTNNQYYSWLVGPSTLKENSFNMGWRILIHEYTNATNFVAITSMGKSTTEDGNACELFYALDDLGYIWALKLDLEAGKVEHVNIETDLYSQYPIGSAYNYCSLLNAGDGSLYFSQFTKTYSTLYRLVYNAEKGSFESYCLGDFGTNYWPAMVCDVQTTETGKNALPVEVWQNAVTVEAETMSEELLAEVATAQPKSVTNPIDADKTVTIDVTVTDAAGNAVPSNNGLVNVEFDAKQLTLIDIDVKGDYSAKIESDGSVIFGYVSLAEIPAGGTVATLTFQAKDRNETTVTVRTEQVDNLAGNSEKITVEFQHENTEVRDVIEATCTTAGYTGDTYCKDCGQLIAKGQIIEALGHSFGEWVVTTEPTCTEKGEETRTCACGEKETRPVDATGHSFGAWQTVKEATCTEDGLETRLCACGEAENRAISATGHDWSDWTETKPATCTEKGEETRTCGNCGETETRATDSFGHDWSDWAETKAATCTEKGEEARTCGNCGEVEKRAIDALGHDCTSVTVSATCTADGYTEYTCQVCGYSYRDDVVPAKGHNYEAYVTAPTCTAKGYTTYTCTACGDSYITDYVDALGHTFGNWVVTKAATCTAAGEETRTCACGETETRVIPATGHSFGDWTMTKAATCTEAGVETRTCACGEIETRAIAALGHDLTERTVAPTCTAEGYTEYTCKVCGYSYREDIVPATGHNYEAVVTEPTCIEIGYTTCICETCGDSYVTDYVPATGHSFGNWVVTTEPTCTAEGEETRCCADCDATETRAIPACCPAEDFTDVDTAQWYHEGVCYVLRNGLMKGKSETIFAPNANLTRAELVTVLYRMAGTPSVEGLEHPFADVAEDTWYTDAVIWAYNAEVVKGISDTAFAPGANITREQIATILYRFSEAEAVTEDALADFADADKVSDWAVEAMNWAVSVGLINGMDETTLAPQGNATRAQIATILMRYCEN